MELVVVGFHRSGTSLLAQVLHSAGLFLGDELLGAMPSNRFGHYEDREVLEIHRRILDDNGTGWQVDAPGPLFIGADMWQQMQDFVGRRQAAHRIWGFKEPRVCLFLGAWKYLMPDAKFVVVYRDPSQSVRSLHDRHANDYLRGSGPSESHLKFFRDPDHGLKLWDTYNRAIVNFAKQHLGDFLVVPYARLSSNYPVVDLLNSKFGAGLRPVATQSVFDQRAVGVQESPRAVHSSEVRARVSRTWSDLENLAIRTDH